mmetsp:Transcript_26554/g.44893  ORF Transcript_26554/g.44893 Transcript_26554/m.44893 type:complete len:324 (-) Transcript_26554:1621-2592(-)
MVNSNPLTIHRAAWQQKNVQTSCKSEETYSTVSLTRKQTYMRVNHAMSTSVMEDMMDIKSLLALESRSRGWVPSGRVLFKSSFPSSLTAPPLLPLTPVECCSLIGGAGDCCLTLLRVVLRVSSMVLDQSSPFMRSAVSDPHSKASFRRVSSLTPAASLALLEDPDGCFAPLLRVEAIPFTRSTPCCRFLRTLPWLRKCDGQAPTGGVSLGTSRDIISSVVEAPTKFSAISKFPPLKKSSSLNLSTAGDGEGAVCPLLFCADDGADNTLAAAPIPPLQAEELMGLSNFTSCPSSRRLCLAGGLGAGGGSSLLEGTEGFVGSWIE